MAGIPPQRHRTRERRTSGAVIDRRHTLDAMTIPFKLDPYVYATCGWWDDAGKEKSNGAEYCPHCGAPGSSSHIEFDTPRGQCGKNRISTSTEDPPTT